MTTNLKRLLKVLAIVFVGVVGLLLFVSRDCRTKLIFTNQTSDPLTDVAFHFSGGPWTIDSVMAGQTVSQFIKHGESDVRLTFQNVDGEIVESTVVGYLTNGMQGSTNIVFDGTISAQENVTIFPNCELNFLSQILRRPKS